MPLGVKILVFTFGELMSIVLGLIPFSKLELFLFHAKTLKNFVLLAFYINNIFGAFKIYQKFYLFQPNNFFLQIGWSKLKLAFSKLKIDMTKIFTLREKYDKKKDKIKVK